ncbi:MAG: excinuclease ABC subunit UvrB [Candidatus Hydrothermarchaeales archaeon]
MPRFELTTDLKPKGDQPKAKSELVEGFKKGLNRQTLLGVTGSGKTFTMANVIEELQKPTIIISHNKTLAAQLYNEFRDLFGENSVEYFVSYYDYYQPEAYIPRTDTYIGKEVSRNEEIEKLRLSATSSLLSRNDVIVVATVSCIYGLGSPEDYSEMVLSLKVGDAEGRNDVLSNLVEMQYERNDIDFTRGKIRVRGDVVEIFPSYSNNPLRVEFFGDEIERIREVDPLKGTGISDLDQVVVYPAKHFVTSSSKMERAYKAIEEELEERVEWFKRGEKLLEAQRLEQRTRYDLEMMREIGYCQGIENYSRHINERKKGEPPYTLLDYFPKDYLLIIDESHRTIPQIRGMYEGDKSRKENLVEYGFRLPSALDNRPLRFDEFEKRLDKVLYVSATPESFEMKNSSKVVEQIIRPTGLVDPVVEVKPATGQVDDLIGEIRKVVSMHERVLVTTLTKKMAENLSEYLAEIGFKVRYLHSEIDTLERVEIIRDLRMGVFDVLVGINLLREGLDIPEVSLVAILDADQEGFLRSQNSLIQTIGRASRNLNGRVIMYADSVTTSMGVALGETNRRRKLQKAFNQAHSIIPESIIKGIPASIGVGRLAEMDIAFDEDVSKLSREDAEFLILQLDADMRKAAEMLEFERAALLRDKIKELEKIF